MYICYTSCTHTHNLDLSNAFGLLVQWPEDPQEKLLVFKLEHDDTSKTDTVHRLAKLMAEAHFSTNSVRKLIELILASH